MAANHDDEVWRIRQLRVSVEHLGEMAKYCTGVGAFVPETRDVAYDADRKALTGGPEKQSALGSDNISGVTDLCARMAGVHREVDAALRAISMSLEKAGRAVTAIATEFGDADKRNQVTAEQLRASIDGHRKK